MTIRSAFLFLKLPMSHLSSFPDTSETSETVSSVARAPFKECFKQFSRCATQTAVTAFTLKGQTGPRNGEDPRIGRTTSLEFTHKGRRPKNRASRRGRRPENWLDCCLGLRVLFPCPALASALSWPPGPLSGHSLCSWSWVTPCWWTTTPEPILSSSFDETAILSGTNQLLKGAQTLQPINKERAPTQEPALQILGEMSRRAPKCLRYLGLCAPFPLCSGLPRQFLWPPPDREFRVPARSWPAPGCAQATTQELLLECFLLVTAVRRQLLQRRQGLPSVAIPKTCALP